MKALIEILNKKSSVIAVFLAGIIWSATVFNISNWKEHNIIKSDVIIYYAYLPATFIYHDLSFEFVEEVPPEANADIWYETTDDGERVLKMSMGQSILYMPFFFTAHAYSYLFGYDTGGYSMPYHMFLALSSVFYALIGLIFVRKILRRYFNEIVVSLVIISIAFGTNIFYYITSESAMSHPYSFSLIAVFLWLTLRWHERPDYKKVLLLGLLGGLITLVRPTNMMVFVIPVLYGITDLKTFKEKMNLLFIQNFPKIILCAIAFSLVILPQLLYWKYATGDWVYYSYGKEGFRFTDPHVLDGLFSYRKGWLVYTPLMGIGIAGFFFLRGALKKFIVPLAFFMALFIYVTFSWWTWWYGGSFGARPMIDTYAIMAIPLAALYQKFLSRKIILKLVLALLVFSLIFLNLFQTLQKRRNIIHYDSMTEEAYWRTFLSLENPYYLWFIGVYDKPNYGMALRGEEEYGVDPELEIKSMEKIEEEVLMPGESKECVRFDFGKTEDINAENTYLKTHYNIFFEKGPIPDVLLNYDVFQNGEKVNRFYLRMQQLELDAGQWNEVNALFRPREFYFPDTRRDVITVKLINNSDSEVRIKDFEAGILKEK